MQSFFGKYLMINELFANVKDGNHYQRSKRLRDRIIM